MIVTLKNKKKLLYEYLNFQYTSYQANKTCNEIETSHNRNFNTLQKPYLSSTLVHIYI